MPTIFTGPIQKLLVWTIGCASTGHERLMESIGELQLAERNLEIPKRFSGWAHTLQLALLAERKPSDFCQFESLPIAMKIKIIDTETRVSIKESNLSSLTFNTGECLLGRSPHSDLFLDSPDLSRIHGKFSRESGEYYFTDLGSSNGSLVNGYLATANQKYRLCPGDRVRVGTFEMEFQAEAKQERTVCNPLIDLCGFGAGARLPSGGSLDELDAFYKSDRQAASSDGGDAAESNDSTSTDTDAPKPVAIEESQAGEDGALSVVMNAEDLAAMSVLEAGTADTGETTAVEKSVSAELERADPSEGESLAIGSVEMDTDGSEPTVTAELLAPALPEIEDEAACSQSEPVLTSEADATGAGEAALEPVAEESLVVAPQLPEAEKPSISYERAENALPASEPPIISEELEVAPEQAERLPAALSCDSDSDRAEAVTDELPRTATQYVALMAHPKQEDALIELVARHQDFLSTCLTIAPPTIGTLLAQQLNFQVTQETPAIPPGGYQAVNALVAAREMLAVIFLRDFTTLQSAQANDEALTRSCNINQTMFASNMPTAEAIVYYLQNVSVR